MTPTNKKLRILFISPPYVRFMGLANCRFPLSFGSMATMLAMNNHEVGIYDADFDKNFIGRSGNYEYTFSNHQLIVDALKSDNHYVWKEIEEMIKGFNPHVVGITTMTNKYPMAGKIAHIVKTLNQDIRVVIGGHHASIFGERLLRDDNNIDFAVIGEGEMTFLELVNRMCESRGNFSNIRGLVYRAGKEIISTPQRELLRDLDALPIADRGLMINEGYISDNNIMTSRGCPFHCSYCGAQVLWKRKVRRRSVSDVMKEVEYLVRLSSSPNISFWDDSFTADRRYLAELMKELKRIDGLRFSCITRLDLVDGESLSWLRGAGCASILFGIESGSDGILRSMNKRMTTDSMKRKVDLVNKSGITWLGFFMMGYPGETKENILETLRFMKELNPPYAEINVFNPLPGTTVWDDLEKQGVVKGDTDFTKYSQSSLENYFISDITDHEFKELALFMAREFDKHNGAHYGSE
jgi:radical SAM superfamily enzyme YgiQ (UPF0313 family)